MREENQFLSEISLVCHGKSPQTLSRVKITYFPRLRASASYGTGNKNEDKVEENSRREGVNFKEIVNSSDECTVSSFVPGNCY